MTRRIEISNPSERGLQVVTIDVSNDRLVSDEDCERVAQTIMHAIDAGIPGVASGNLHVRSFIVPVQPTEF